MMEMIRFEYKPNLWVFGFCGLLFGVATVVLVHLALSVDSEAAINHSTRIHPGAEKAMAWAMVMCSAMFVFISLRIIKRAFGPKRYVVLDEHSISAPKRASSKTIETVPLYEITNLMVYSIRSTPYLEIRHNHGQLTINGDMLGSRYYFDKLVETLRERSLGRVVSARSGGMLSL